VYEDGTICIMFLAAREMREGSLKTGFRKQVLNHLMPPGLRVLVVSDEEKA